MEAPEIAIGVSSCKSFTITFHGEGDGEVGRLFIDEEGKLHFAGDLHESARIFFEYGVKQLSDAYIQNAMEKKEVADGTESESD